MTGPGLIAKIYALECELIQARLDAKANAIWSDCHKDNRDMWSEEYGKIAKKLELSRTISALGWALFLASAFLLATS